MTMSFHIICLVVFTLLLVRYNIAEESSLEFSHFLFYKFESQEEHSVTIVESNATYHQLPLTAEDKELKIPCQLFISLNEEQDKGIHTCQGDDHRYYLEPSQNLEPAYLQPDECMTCKFPNIIEKEEVTFPCEIKKMNSSEITVGWIQRHHHSVQIYSEPTFNITLKDFYFEEGIFFYCIKYNASYDVCCTLTLKVKQRLIVNITSLHSTDKFFGYYCFECHVTGGSNKTVYKWRVNETSWGDDHNSETNKKCFNELSAGKYTVRCLVTTAAQNKSGEITFIVIHIKPTSKTTKDDEEDDDENERKEDDNDKFYFKIYIITIATTIIILLCVVLLYLWKKNKGIQLRPEQQRNDANVQGISGGSQTMADDNIYYTINDISYAAENDIVNTNAESNERENKKDGNREEGNRQGDNRREGNVENGNREDGNRQIDNTQDGNGENGNKEDGNRQGDNTQDGNIEDGNREDGNREEGNIENDNIEVGKIEDGNIEVGHRQDGHREDGNRQIDNTQDGNREDGKREDGNIEDGKKEDGNREDGNREDGNREDGNIEDGKRESGNIEDGNREDGNGENGNRDDDNREDCNRNTEAPHYFVLEF